MKGGKSMKNSNWIIVLLILLAPVFILSDLVKMQK